ncbi:MAG: D-alanyl-D-alanine carboxypeptidase/D-alanyl-D-alanine-endopeptidase [Deltaproteobacteria bacterium]|nr:MAG: D-alanyl-D-alanine carboxypeptidase/D-alanyl-D-alanine-endopeptidase [Deltaproteobacteria bacterium]
MTRRLASRAALAARLGTLGALVVGLAAPTEATPAPAAPGAGPDATPAEARPAPVRARTVKPTPRPVASKPATVASQHDGAHARVAINHAGDLRPAREASGRREEPLTAEEDTARQIEKLLRGPLRYGVTGLFVADARTGEALFAVNADDPLNPASNVKMISTAAALELLGPDFRYPTRLLGPTPDGGVVHGDVYLLGSHDPTLAIGDLDEIAAAVAARGVTRIEGGIAVGADPTRDGVYRAVIPIDIRAGEPGAPAIAAPASGMDLVAVTMAARTATGPGRARLTFQTTTTHDVDGHPRIALTIGGTIGRGGAARFTLATRERTATAAYTLRAALRARGVAIAGELRTEELPGFVARSVAASGLPVELGRHDSARLADIIARVNKWSINWLADRVIMTAAALVHREPPSMELALAAMYDWMTRHPRIAKSDVIVDTGSGLSYRTRITAHELVSIVRSAAGFVPDSDAAQSRAWLDSLSVGGTDGTLSSRFRSGDVRGRLRGKTGTMSTAIALSGVLEVDPQRPLAFSLVTNGDSPLSSRYVRRAHEQLVGLLCRYLAVTRKPGAAELPTPPPPVQEPVPTDAERADLEDLEPDPALDSEIAPTP